MSTAPGTTGDVVTKSIRLLAAQGYHATTVDQLAQATGVSRATFFRKYGSKEDIVFADHASNLERLEQLLSRPNLTAQAGLAEGVQLVFRHNLDHSDRAIARHHLLQQVEGLRDRELATSHRYERLFQGFLRRVLPENADQRVTAVALASATVPYTTPICARGYGIRSPTTVNSWLQAQSAHRLAVYGIRTFSGSRADRKRASPTRGCGVVLAGSCGPQRGGRSSRGRGADGAFGL
ncbi:TetR/AcrR family transcriptional regulator [Kocuria atrinae]|uniref:TetR/AcrR family transcriptional regulator n=1 Tax=Kocuria atrinae TaxID=592377 RepID=UPI0002F5F993|nr:TetR/AcrR family transcriptional regulator [Kocuria atrinae]